MKTKYILIYVFVGIAFLAVSAWVFFTHGKNAKAIRTKYRLGGIMLMCMAMLSVASCGEIGDPFVTCYDPAPEYSFAVSTEKRDADWQYRLSPGAILTVQADCRFYDNYGIVIRQFADGKEGEILYTATFGSDGKDQFQCKLVYDPADKEYAGIAQLSIFGYPEGSEQERILYVNYFVVTTGED